MLETISNNAEQSFLSTPRSMLPGSWNCDTPKVIEEKPTPTPPSSNGFSIAMPKLEQREASENAAPGEFRDETNDGDRDNLSIDGETPKKFECDYDKDPTEIFLALQKKEWEAAEKFANENAVEARTWVSRREKHGKLRWRLLPIHAAIIFKAPDSVVETLLAAYPKGAQSKDDQGMLPLHLAFRHGSTEGSVNLLLVAYPQSVTEKDRKGRIPLVLAQASASPNREAFVRALERGPTYYANAAAATERAAVTAEQRAIFDSKLIEVEKKHQQDVNILKEERRGLEETVELLQKELTKQKGATQVLVDHVNSLEAQLKVKAETERFLAVKAATLDTTLKELNGAKESSEEELKSEIQNLMNQNDELRAQIEDLSSGEESPMQVKHMKDKLLKHEKELKNLKMDWASAQARAAVLEAQLKSKIENEHELASQVSQLAGKLAESAAESGNSTAMYSKRVHALEEEREKLRAAVNDLGKKLLKVSHFMNKMTQKTQETNSKKKITNEENKKKHEQLLADAASHEEMLRHALEEKKQMAELLKKQEQEMERSALQHQAILEKLAAFKASVPTAEVEDDDDDLPLTYSLAEEMNDMMTTVLNDMPKRVLSDDSDIVDDVMENVAASTPKAGVARNKGFFDQFEKKEMKEVKLPEENPTTTLRETFSLDSDCEEEDAQKCLEEALRALELSRTKSHMSTMPETSVSTDSGDESPSLTGNPSDEGSKTQSTLDKIMAEPDSASVDE